MSKNGATPHLTSEPRADECIGTQRSAKKVGGQGRADSAAEQSCATPVFLADCRKKRSVRTRPARQTRRPARIHFVTALNHNQRRMCYQRWHATKSKRPGFS